MYSSEDLEKFYSYTSNYSEGMSNDEKDHYIQFLAEQQGQLTHKRCKSAERKVASLKEKLDYATGERQ